MAILTVCRLRAAKRSAACWAACLRDNDVIDDVVQIVQRRPFLHRCPPKDLPGHRQPAHDKGHPADLVTLAEWLKEQKFIEDVGGYSYLAELWDAAPTAANAEYYARIVRDKGLVRQLIHTSTEILRDAYEQATPADEMLGGAERKVFEIAADGGHRPAHYPPTSHQRGL